MATLSLTPRSPAGWSGRVTYKKATIRDPYGKAVAHDTAELPARVRLTQVQLAEAGGTRALRDGLVATVPWQDWLAVNDELVHRGATFQIIGLDAPEDYRGRLQFAVLTCVKLRGGA